jgi:hypothetical protein
MPASLRCLRLFLSLHGASGCRTGPSRAEPAHCLRSESASGIPISALRASIPSRKIMGQPSAELFFRVRGLQPLAVKAKPDGRKRGRCYRNALPNHSPFVAARILFQGSLSVLTVASR